MQIERKDLDNLTAQLNIKINEKDYAEKVEKKLKEYRKQIEMPGFRKGKVPLGLIKKKFERALIIEEVSNQVQDALNNYIDENKIKILGYPIPSEKQAETDWMKGSDFEINYDLGLAPEIDIDLSKLEGITQYKITADKKIIDEEIARIKEQYGTFEPLEEVKENSQLIGTFTNEAENIKSEALVRMVDLTPNVQKDLLGKKKGDTVELQSSDLFKDPHKLMIALNIDYDKVHDLDIPVNFEIKGIFELKPAEINKELLDNIYGEDKIEDEEGLRKYIKENFEKELENISDKRLFNDVTDKLIETVEIDLPKDFLIRWMTFDNEKLTLEEAEQEYEKYLKGIKYQLLENAIATKYDIKITYDEVLSLTKSMLMQQMAQYGQDISDEKKIEETAKELLKKEKEFNYFSDLILKDKLIQLYKKEIPVHKKRIGYQKFLDLLDKKNEGMMNKE